MNEVIIRTHGTAKSDPGTAAIAIAIVDASGAVLAETSEVIGNATSVYAAFMAVVRGLGMAVHEFGSKTTDMRFTVTISDETVKQQINGEAAITNPGIVPHFIAIHNLKVASFPHLSFTYVALVENGETGRLVKEALDAA